MSYLNADKLEDKLRRSVNYMDHTVMPQALEKRPEEGMDMLQSRHLQILGETYNFFMNVVLKT